MYIDEIAQIILDEENTLIGGVPGSGKSTLVDTVCSAACSYSPDEKRFAIVDLKQISLRQWENTPHCMAYADTADAALELIEKFENTMLQRTQAMLAKGVRIYPGKDLYLIIDEAAFLLSLKPEVAKPLARIGVLGRACKIHVIYCTQIPNRKTIPAELQATFTCTVALRCAKDIESRQLMGDTRCTKLPKYGKGYIVCSKYDSIPKGVILEKIPDEELHHQIYMLTGKAPRFV